MNIILVILSLIGAYALFCVIWSTVVGALVSVKDRMGSGTVESMMALGPLLPAIGLVMVGVGFLCRLSPAFRKKQKEMQDRMEARNRLHKARTAEWERRVAAGEKDLIFSHFLREEMEKNGEYEDND